MTDSTQVPGEGLEQSLLWRGLKPIKYKVQRQKRVFLLPKTTKTPLSNKVFIKAPQPHEIKGKTQLP